MVSSCLNYQLALDCNLGFWNMLLGSSAYKCTSNQFTSIGLPLKCHILCVSQLAMFDDTRGQLVQNINEHHTLYHIISIIEFSVVVGLYPSYPIISGDVLIFPIIHNYFLWVISSRTQFSDIVYGIPSGSNDGIYIYIYIIIYIYTYSDILFDILCGIYSDILSDILHSHLRGSAHWDQGAGHRWNLEILTWWGKNTDVWIILRLMSPF